MAGFIMTGVIQGSAGIRRLLRRIVLWRVGLWWYLFALFGIPAITVLGAVVLPGALGSWQMPAWHAKRSTRFLGPGISSLLRSRVV